MAGMIFVRFLPVVRILFVSIAAAAVGSAIASLILWGYVDKYTFIALPFALVGSCLLLAPAYGWARENGLAIEWRYITLLLSGAIAGGLFLTFISLDIEKAPMGALYGFATAVCWVVIHFLTKQVFPSAMTSR
jgi:hypothetical protein